MPQPQHARWQARLQRCIMQFLLSVPDSRDIQLMQRRAQIGHQDLFSAEQAGDAVGDCRFVSVALVMPRLRKSQ